MPEAVAPVVLETFFEAMRLTNGLVVHEAVHAVLATENRTLTRLVDETAA